MTAEAAQEQVLELALVLELVLVRRPQRLREPAQPQPPEG